MATELARRAAAAAGDEVPENLDPEEWWERHGDGEPLGYSGLLGALASTPAARRALLAGFFEPTDDEREDGLKVPGPAHRAIADLVSRGLIRVILTTNFDRLIEQALESEGILPQVIASPSALSGMEPLAHARCTVVKLHGDYASLDQLNTVEELSTYSDETTALLDRVLDEYGLVINGWSGDWDRALVEAIEGTSSRRYPMFWVSHRQPGDVAKRLIAQHRAHVITGAPADQFFPDLVTRIEALDSLADPPLSLAMAIAQLKRALPDSTKHIQLRDLIDGQVQRLRGVLADRPQMPDSTEPQAFEDAHESLRQETDTLLHLLANGVYLDRDRVHADLWVWTIEQLMAVRKRPDGQYHPWWDALQHYPALLALRTATMAALAAKHEDVLIRLLTQPTWRDQNEISVPAFAALHDYQVLDPAAINTFPMWNITSIRFIYPQSHLLKHTLRPVFVPLIGDENTYLRVFHQTEYRMALANKFLDSPRRSYAAPGEFISDSNWSVDGLIWEDDFRKSGDHAAWGWTKVADGEPDEFSDKLAELTAELRSLPRRG